MSKIKERLGLLKRKTLVATVGEVEWTFHVVSIPMLFELRTTLEPLCRGFQILCQSNKNDVAETVQSGNDETGRDVFTKHRTAIAADLARVRREEADASFKAMMDGIFDPKNKLLVARVLADSLRGDNDFGKNPADAEIAEFSKSLDLDLLIQFLKPFLEVNAKVFGPLGERGKVMVMRKLAEKIDDLDASGSVPSAEPLPQPEA